MKTPFKLMGLILLVFMAPAIAMANVSIVATVNGKPITNYDVEARVGFLLFATNITLTEGNRQRIYDDALQLLIDDLLKLETARTAYPEIQAFALPQVTDLINQNFADGDKRGMLVLREQGVDPISVQTKYLSDIAWSSFISNRFETKFQKIDDQVDDELSRLKANASKPQLQLAEIILTPGPTRNLDQTRALAEEMVAVLRRGANFAEIARQYSASGSASRGGDVGWNITERLPRAFRDALEVVEDGGITDPILLDGAVYIFRRISERRDGLADISQARVWLARAIVPLNATASNADRLEAAARLERDTETVNDCDALVALNDTYGADAISRLDEMLIADMAPQMRKLVSALEVNVASPPLSFAEGVASMMLCRIEKPEIKLPSRDEVKKVLLDKLFGSLSERQLLRLRRTAVIEYRTE